jgi:type IX secretion system PorP/SprF family membrane protein
MHQYRRKIGYLLGCILLATFTSFAQYEPFYVQHFNNQLVLNPAFTGFRNALAVDLSVRKQWVGIDGAPQSAFVAAHSPINNTKLSFGGYFQTWSAGPLSSKQGVIDYSYLARLGDRMFLSLGLNAGIINQQMGLTDLVLVDGGDPNFENAADKVTFPIIGAGAVIFTPLFYVGVSRPSIPVVNFNDRDNKVNPIGNYYAMGGVSLPKFHKITTKISFLSRWSESKFLVFDITGRTFYKDKIGVGFSYRPNHSWSAMAEVQVNRNISLTYSYDFPLPKTPFVTFGSHEITLSYDIYEFYERNKYRLFKRKKVVEDEEVRSIRFF